MTALTKDRNTPEKGDGLLALGAAANKKIYAGALVARDANGYATPGATAVGLLGLGRARAYVDNTGGANGDQSVEIERGVYAYANSAGGDQIGNADIGSLCYIVDDQTVAKTSATNTRSVAGKVYDVDSSGVWVDFEHTS